MKKFLVIFSLIIVPLSFNQMAKADLYDDGIKAYRDNNFTQAEYYFKEAIKINPDNVRYRYYLAITMVQQGNIFQAEKQYQKVLELAPESEAAEKAKKGLSLITIAKDKLLKNNEPTAMTSVLEPSNQKVIIPIHKSNNAIIVPSVLVNNRVNVNFILDTGATYTSISRQTAQNLGINITNTEKVTLKTANGLIKVPKVTLESININGLIARNVEVTIHDLPAAKNITGLLGLSFLEKFTVTIDKKNNKIIIQNS